VTISSAEVEMGDDSTRSTRRQFLRGQSAIDALDDLGRRLPLASPLDDPGDLSGAPQTYLLHVAREAMACQFAVFLNAGESEGGTERAVEALELVSQLEEQLSVYRHRSEVSLLNAAAAKRPVRVEPRLFDLLQQANELYAATDGAFDITSGPLIRAWGFYGRQGRLPTDEAISEALQRVGGQRLQLGPEPNMVRFLKPDLEINLGGIGKGYALDRCAELLQQSEISNFMIHGGHSSILTRGERVRGDSQGGWSVGLRHPLRPDRRLGQVCLRDQALATSGAGTQHFYAQGRRFGHIIDPRSGQPADHLISATVLAERAAEADALSTAFYVLGLEQATEYCEKHPKIAALLTSAGPRAGTMTVHPVGLSEDQWQQLSD
jgi:thiamine biosynthesis lipoprotein